MSDGKKALEAFRNKFHTTRFTDDFRVDANLVAAMLAEVAFIEAAKAKAEAECDRLREILQTLEKGGLEPWQSSQIARQALKDTKTMTAEHSQDDEFITLINVLAEARPPKWLEEQISKALAKLNALPPERQIP